MKYNFKEEVPYFVNSSLSRGLSCLIFLGGFFHLLPLDGVWIMQTPPNVLREISPKQKEEKFSRET